MAYLAMEKVKIQSKTFCAFNTGNPLIRLEENAQKFVCYVYGKRQEKSITASLFSVIKKKFFQKDNNNQVWLLYRKLMLHSRNPKITGGLQSNRVNC